MIGTPVPRLQSDPQALAAFEEGCAAFHAGDPAAAHAEFQRAYRRDGRDPRVMSWYGVTLVLVEKNSNLGMQLCDQALRLSLDPELMLNLARVHLELGQRDRVLQVVMRGLDLWPEDPRLRAARAALGVRRTPVLPFLERGSVLNRALGALRHPWRARRGPVVELSPLTLGVPIASSAAERRS